MRATGRKLFSPVAPCPLSRQCRIFGTPWLGSLQPKQLFSRWIPLRAEHRRYGSNWRGALRDVLKVSPEVRDALETNKPVVALESTIYTHGALGVDLRLESIVRENGAVPAVVGILDGIPSVGLLPAEVHRMVHEGAKKVSRRDLAYLVGMGMVGKKIHGGTTIAGTMILARLAGIRVFGTGGLGGVHRGWENTLDVSADLTELGRTRVAVVCSGSKGFLDIPATLEYLETQGVLVSTFADGRPGKVDFPAFWARESGIKSPSVVENEREAAAIILAQEQLHVESGILFANAISQEYAIPREDMEVAIDQAVAEAREQSFSGNENTPFILRRIRELTQGRSVPANIALVQQNVARAAMIAQEICQMMPEGSSGGKVVLSPQIKSFNQIAENCISETTRNEVSDEAAILVAGSVAVDLSCDYTGGSNTQVTPQLYTSNPASISQSIGGVGHNVALAAYKLNPSSKVKLCSLVGDDLAGAAVLSTLKESGLDTSHVRKLPTDGPSSRTAQYVAVNDGSKNLTIAMADMDIFTAPSSQEHCASAVAAAKPKWLVVDANWTSPTIHTWLSTARKHGAKTAFEPVSVAKSARLFPTTKEPRHLGIFPNATVDLATPNQHELAAMHAAAREHGYLDHPSWFDVVDAFGISSAGARDRFVRLTSAVLTDAGIPQQSVQLLPYVPTLVTKLGARGVLLAAVLRRDDPRLRDRAAEPYILARGGGDHAHVGGVYMRYFPAAERVEDADVVSVNGVGDTFLGALLAGLARGGSVEGLVGVAQRAAVLTLRSRLAVSERLGELREELAAACKDD